MEMSMQQENSDIKSISGSGSCLYDLFCCETPSLNSQSQREQWMLYGPQERLDNLMRQAGNKFCADCGSSDPKWVSSSLGVFICIKCSGIHRSLGVHISKVLSLNLDDWTDEQVDALVNLGGNTVINKKYEACLPSYIKKPKPTSSIEERSDFIRRKYELQQFVDSEENLTCPFIPSHARSSSSSHSSSSYNNPPQDKKRYDKQTTKNRIGLSFRNSWGRKESESKSTKKSNSLAGMVEFIGLIKVNVVKGTNLAIRDLMTSDPYVILSLGHQSVKTRVIKSNLNPVWNESLMLSIPESIPPLKVIVYDKDSFKTDDFMGEAEIDIQPLVSAAKAYEKSSINESMQLGKWVASGDNTLVKDGIISLEEGKVRQEISLRLQNVERGVLEIELECVPLTQ
ncbi:probable ADP-ribosylation factor GTPase-activating protein AGD11 isoform X2 [Cicer arietinum]|uniref:Probable ADP-ribosylation factor GTPase-activating protein AGD11 isoform X2 n=1 Tax=Cicer arietinum TaxID=3827 RepID=A0A1S2Z3N1_CICAR|nr:probable ADP-ribosylation factor GTPase-activating protein AGD11 isoform X2 [Cicer arietinum]XP_027186293.1 probable ADP-ribosylation factor GTPase-activating protein AGD11 isoform X2 [Cicer arietinum]XP_027186294.1 probable ADP-ribosylation factor GTPase-activating protein AGD11 isoform X2 [Cicer arietinum]